MECPHAYRKIGISISLPRMSIFEGKTRKNAWVEGSIWKKSDAISVRVWLGRLSSICGLGVCWLFVGACTYR